MKYLIPLLLLTGACASTAPLYPTQSSMDRTCKEVVNDTYASLDELNRNTNKSNIATISVSSGVTLASILVNPLAVVALPLYYGLEYAIDPFNKGKPRGELNSNLRMGYAKDCVEEDR